jgi:hypothetical protein
MERGGRIVGVHVRVQLPRALLHQRRLLQLHVHVQVARADPVIERDGAREEDQDKRPEV